MDTIATTISSTAYQLAEYPEIQTKIREEIRVEEEKLKENHVNYEFIRDLKYLDMVLSGNSRKIDNNYQSLEKSRRYLRLNPNCYG